MPCVTESVKVPSGLPIGDRQLAHRRLRTESPKRNPASTRCLDLDQRQVVGSIRCHHVAPVVAAVVERGDGERVRVHDDVVVWSGSTHSELTMKPDPAPGARNREGTHAEMPVLVIVTTDGCTSSPPERSSWDCVRLNKLALGLQAGLGWEQRRSSSAAPARRRRKCRPPKASRTKVPSRGSAARCACDRLTGRARPEHRGGREIRSGGPGLPRRPLGRRRRNRRELPGVGGGGTAGPAAPRRDSTSVASAPATSGPPDRLDRVGAFAAIVRFRRRSLVRSGLGDGSLLI